MYKAFCYYDKKGRRLSIFGEKGGLNVLITVIPCSKNDIFKKSIAKELYNRTGLSLEVNCELFVIPIIDDKPRKSFIDWCELNYYKQKLEFKVFTRRILVKRNELKNIPISRYKQVNTKLSQI